MNRGKVMGPFISEENKISPSLTFFLIHSMQIGIGVLGFQRIIAMSAGYDAWISVILAGIGIHILIWMMFKMLQIVDGDIISIHTFIFGERIGKFISSLLIIYLMLPIITVLRGYIEIVQVWMFPSLETFWFALVFLLLAIYTVMGGFRTVTGIAFFSTILPLYIIFIFLYTLPYADFSNLLPVLDHSVKDLFKGSRDLSLTILGFDTLLIFYPFIKKPEKAKKWAHFSILFTTFLLVYLSVLAFAYFPKEQLLKNLWPTLTMWKIIQMPFVERFEYIGIASWILIILPNVCIPLWCASRLAKQILSFRQKTAVWVLSLICLAGVSLLTTRFQINYLGNIAAKAGFYFNFAYIPLLFFATLLVKKVKKT